MTSNVPAGLYYAEGDPPNTQRYWDGVSWQGGPQLVGAVPPRAVPVFGFGETYAEPSQADTALILSLLGYVFCLVTCPFGWYMANGEINAIRAGRRDPSGMRKAKAARILGFVGIFIGVSIYVLLFIFGQGKG